MVIRSIFSLADQDESTFGYAEISKMQSSSDNYQAVYLTMPTDHQYSLIGDMTVNQDDSILYVPVAYLSGNSYNYTWLKYKPATTSFDSVWEFLGILRIFRAICSQVCKAFLME